MIDRVRPGFRLLALVLMFATLRIASAAPGMTGLWLTQDHDGIIKVTNCGNALCAEIAGLILDNPDDPTPVDYRGVSQCHLYLIADARPIKPNLWKGHISDPRNGSVYGVELRLDPNGNLALRGFLGIPLLGHTQTWTRYAGTVPDDCRMAGRPQQNIHPGHPGADHRPPALNRAPHLPVTRYGHPVFVAERSLKQGHADRHMTESMTTRVGGLFNASYRSINVADWARNLCLGRVIVDPINQDLHCGLSGCIQRQVVQPHR